MRKGITPPCRGCAEREEPSWGRAQVGRTTAEEGPRPADMSHTTDVEDPGSLETHLDGSDLELLGEDLRQVMAPL